MGSIVFEEDWRAAANKSSFSGTSFNGKGLFKGKGSFSGTPRQTAAPGAVPGAVGGRVASAHAGRQFSGG
jgi:hypothetical protein